MSHSLVDSKHHIVFSTKYRLPLITAELQPQLYAYIGGIIRNKGGQMIEIGGIEDHVHILARLHQTRSLAAMVGAIKSNSSSFGKDKLGNPAFGWQMGYGAFSVSESRVLRVRLYIQRQKEHHRRMTYEEEVRGLCRRHGIKFDESFLKDDDDPAA